MLFEKNCAQNGAFRARDEGMAGDFSESVKSYAMALAHQRMPLMDLYWVEVWPYWPLTLTFTPSKQAFRPAVPL